MEAAEAAATIRPTTFRPGTTSQPRLDKYNFSLLNVFLFGEEKKLCVSGESDRPQSIFKGLQIFYGTVTVL